MRMTTVKLARLLPLLLLSATAACIDPPPAIPADGEDMPAEQDPDMMRVEADSAPDIKGDMPADDPDMKDSPDLPDEGDMDGEIEPDMPADELDCSEVTTLDKENGVSNRFLVRDACEFLLVSNPTYNASGNVLLLQSSIDVPSSWSPPMEFRATLDGQGHTIRGLKLQEGAQGAFSRDLIGELRDIRFDGIHNTGAEHNEETGALIGNAMSGARLERVVAEGIVLDVTLAEKLGGLIGTIQQGAELRDVEISATISSGSSGRFGLLAAELTGDDALISGVRVRGSVTISESAEGSIESSIGGVVGYWGGGNIERCDVQVTLITLDVDTGGVAGRNIENAGRIRDCIVRGSIDTRTNGGGHVGGVLGQGVMNRLTDAKGSARYEHVISAVEILDDGNAFVGREAGDRLERHQGVGHVALIGNRDKDAGTEAVRVKRLTEEQARNSSSYWQWPASRWTMRAGELPVLGQSALAARCDPMAAPFGGGDGSVVDPFLICSATQLQRVRGIEVGVSSTGGSAQILCEPPADPKHYRLASDIDLSGSGWVPIPCFGAHFDGAGYTIHNLNVDNPDGDFIGGFIEYAKDASIQNVAFEDLTVRSSSGLGGVIYEARGSLVRRVRVGRGSVTAEYDSAVIGPAVTERYASGGVVASLVSGSVAEQLEYEGVLVVDTGTSVEGASQGAIGGVIGFLGSSRASGVDSVATVEVTNAHTNIGGAVGGVAGTSSLEFVQSRASIEAESGQSVGGIVGLLFQTGSIRYASFDGTINADDLIGGAIGVFAESSGEEPARHIEQVWIKGSVSVAQPTGNEAVFAFIGGQPTNSTLNWDSVLWSVSRNEEPAPQNSAPSPEESSSWTGWVGDVWSGSASAGWWPVLRADALASRCAPGGKLGGGDGSFLEPYLFCGPSHLLEGFGQVGAEEHVRIVRDITTGTPEVPLFADLDFHIDGGGHVLSGFEIDGGTYVLFDKVKVGGSLRDLGVDDVRINNNDKAGIIDEVEGSGLVRGLHVRRAEVICEKGKCGMIAKIKVGGLVEDVSFNGEVYSGFVPGVDDAAPEPVTDKLNEVGPEGLIVGELDADVRLIGARARGVLRSSGDDAVGLAIGKMKGGASVEFIDVDARLEAANAERVAGVAGILAGGNSIRFCAVHGELDADANANANALFARYELMGAMPDNTLEISHCLVALDMSPSNANLALPVSVGNEFDVNTSASVYDSARFPEGVEDVGWIGLSLEKMSAELESFLDAAERDGWSSVFWSYMPGVYPRLRL